MGQLVGDDLVGVGTAGLGEAPGGGVDDVVGGADHGGGGGEVRGSHGPNVTRRSPPVPIETSGPSRSFASGGGAGFCEGASRDSDMTTDADDRPAVPDDRYRSRRWPLPPRARRRWPLVAALLVGIGLVLAPVVFQMFTRAPKGRDMIDAFRPYMNESTIGGFQQDMATIGAAADEVPALRAELRSALGVDDAQLDQRYPLLVSFEDQWPGSTPT